MKKNKKNLTGLTSKPLNNKESFFQKVYQVVSRIPEGKVTTYGFIARAIEENGKARAVGHALHAVVDTGIPCHRVVNRNGELTGSIHFATPTLMKELLLSEKIEFIDKKVNMKKHLWVPDVQS